MSGLVNAQISIEEVSTGSLVIQSPACLPKPVP